MEIFTFGLFCVTVVTLFREGLSYDLKRRKMDSEQEEAKRLREAPDKAFRVLETKLGLDIVGSTKALPEPRPFDSASDDPKDWKSY